MFKHFFNLQWKSFFRSASFKTNLAIKIVMGFGVLYFMTAFLMLGVGVYFIIEDAKIGDPLDVVNKYLVYLFAADLFIRYMMQKMPVTNIKPLLYLPFKKGQVVNYSLGKTAVSFFNWSYTFFFLPFSIVLLTKGYDPLGVITWLLGMFALIYCNNFINVMANNKDSFFYPIVAIFFGLAVCHYYGVFDITEYTASLYGSLYSMPWTVIIPWVVLVALYFSAYAYFKKNMYLDAGLQTKQSVAKSEDLSFLDRFGHMGTFLKNDIKLIKRNKRSKTAVMMSFLFLFYGLLFGSGAIEIYDGPIWQIFGGIFVSGGFLFTFGQFVPSWDSAYYQLMMSQNIKYKDYITSKWYLIVIATVISTILASFYLFFGINAYLAIVVGAIYNIGVNSHLVLWGGAYIKMPIDLTSNKKAFGDKQAFNMKTMLLSLPKLGLPVIVFALGYYFVGPITGYILVAAAGILGFAFRNIVFEKIEKIYKKEKYKTINAYKQKA